MFKTLRFRKPFHPENAKVAQILMKSAQHYFYQIFSSICGKLRSIMSLLVMCEVLGLFVNTLSADDKYSLCNSEKLPQPIQMQLSKKHKFFLIFWIFLLQFWNLDQILIILKK